MPTVETTTEYVREDYVHSANSLFNFVSSAEYVIESLQIRALCPRYCTENVRYLNISNGDKRFEEVAVLQKCFCDIPLHEVFNPFPVVLTENNEGLTKEQRELIPEKCSHPELYGEYAIGFSKSWGEKSNLQPIQYLVVGSEPTDEFSKAIEAAIKEEDLPDVIADSISNRICFVKPVRGRMKRRAKNGEKYEYEIFKNYHDEHEWRFVPINKAGIDSLIAKTELLKMSGLLNEMSNTIKEERFQQIWLPFCYDDIRYIIVPNNDGRVEIIEAINDLKDDLFDDGNVELQKAILISKILVINEIAKDL